MWFEQLLEIGARCPLRAVRAALLLVSLDVLRPRLVGVVEEVELVLHLVGALSKPIHMLLHVGIEHLLRLFITDVKVHPIVDVGRLELRQLGLLLEEQLKDLAPALCLLGRKEIVLLRGRLELLVLQPLSGL